MPTFQEFLEELAGQQNQKERRERRAEWIAAVDRLLQQIRAWLAESDSQNLLDVVPLEFYGRVEPNLGVYDIPGLKIGVGEAAVKVMPMGRDVIGIVALRGNGELRAEGRVDIADGVRRYILYRTLQDGKETLYALDEDFKAAPLDRARPEAILQYLLS